MVKIAVTGYRGRLGSELIKWGCVPLECDITNQQEIELAVASVKPDVVINCAAYTNVDGCEMKTVYQHALAVNTWGVGKLRDIFNGKLIHISTDYVFSGKDGAYSEKFFRTFPVNNYGYSKVGGENLLLTHNNKNTIIIRTTGLYGGCSKKSDFVSKVLGSLRDKEPIQISNQLHGNQTYVPHLAEALIYCANADNLPMVLHIGSKEVVTRYEFALMIANVFEYDPNSIVPVKNEEVPRWVAPRPIKGGLKVKLAQKCKVPLYTIMDGLKKYKEESWQPHP